MADPYNTHILQSIDHINQSMDCMLNQILHHPRFQAMESLWRSTYKLVGNAQPYVNRSITLKVLNLSYEELSRDMAFTSDISHAFLFNQINTQAYEHAGGEPFGLLIGNYTFMDTKTSSFDDIHTLRTISSICAQSFTPFISHLSSHFLAIDTYDELYRHTQYDHTETQYARWESLKAKIDSRYLTLCAPDILLREPYPIYSCNHSLRFKEQINNRHDLLWGNPAFDVAIAILHSYAQTGWFMNIYSTYYIPANHMGQSRLPKIDTQKHNHLSCYISNALSIQLARLGVLSLRYVKFSQAQFIDKLTTLHSSYCLISSTQQASSPLHSELAIILCTARFAHTLKTMMRDKVGRYMHASELQSFLQTWLIRYCSQTHTTSHTQYPLKSSQVSVRNHPGKPGHFLCDLLLSPHHFINGIQTHYPISCPLTLTVQGGDNDN